MLRCESSGELYPLRPTQPTALSASIVPADLWHARLGHPGNKTLHQVLQSFDFNCNKSAVHLCSSCQLGKHVRQPFSSSQTVTYFPFQLVHSDVWTSPIHSNSGYKYYLVLLDDFTHYIWTFAISLTSSPSYSPSMLTFRLSSVFLGWHCKPIMVGNSILMPCVPSFFSTAYTCASHVPILPNRTGRLSVSFARLTIVCVLC
jgi:hypothetical protein